MGRYADWSDYGAIFSGPLSEEDFLAAIGTAEAYIDVLTGGRAEEAEGYAKERLKAAACALAEQIARERTSEQARRMAISAVTEAYEAEAEGEMQIEEISNDGYSEKYYIRDAGSDPAGGELADAFAHGADMARWDGIVRRWLSGTGLVSAI